MLLFPIHLSNRTPRAAVEQDAIAACLCNFEVGDGQAFAIENLNAGPPFGFAVCQTSSHFRAVRNTAQSRSVDGSAIAHTAQTMKAMHQSAFLQNVIVP